MAVLPRKLQTIFAGGLTPTGNVAQPGSTLAGTPVYSNDLDVLQDLAATTAAPWLNGLQDQCVSTQAQVLEEMNAVLLVVTQQLAYLLERGQSEWLATQLYYQYAIATVGGVQYQCKAASSINENPTTNTNVWANLLASNRSPATLSAFVIFDGTAAVSTNCVILQGFNVTSVFKRATGSYLVTFTNGMTVDMSGNGLYGFSGSAGTQNGASSIGGDNNIINGGGPIGSVAVKTATQCGLFNWESNNAGSGVLEDSGCISVSFFG